MTDKIRVATVSLAGCFGCHMSLLDIDERLLQLADRVAFDRSPITDIKHCEACDIGLIEGGVCNSENVHTLREFRKHCKFLVAVGACAINGGLPGYRNYIPLEECLGESYLDGIGIENPQIPSDPELPLLLDKVYPVHEVVKIDYFLPGCPPVADVFWTFLTDLLEGREPALPYELIHYD
ncbi:NADH-quinone oxidoreductase subunit B family protein [Methylobacter marinus]|uniref:NADH-quinone oxidoreductase subunit B family protein n=1 Tax=Methylobacter marinus TaxID=34058 RepID=UPI00035C7EA7|nr:NADP oxidoreductase [Methylobacter marinus]